MSFLPEVVWQLGPEPGSPGFFSVESERVPLRPEEACVSQEAQTSTEHGSSFLVFATLVTPGSSDCS